MKTTLRYTGKLTLCLLAACTMLLNACKKDDNPETREPEITSTAGVYMLCEGSLGQGNSAITFYNVNTGVTEKNYYKKVNGTDLGETAVDLQRYGSKMYCVVSGLQGQAKSFVDVMDAATAKTIKRISFNSGNAGFLPRYIAFYKNKAYVSRYDGKVSRIDTASLTIDGEVTLSEGLEGLVIANGKLYVANSAHYLYPNGKKEVVSVIDLSTFAKLKDITVNYNPQKIAAAASGDVYVISYGDYAGIPGNLERISSVTDTRISTGTVAGIDYSSSIGISGSRAYVSVTDASTYLPIIKSVNTATGGLGGNFITDGTSLGILYGLTLNPFNGDVFAADAISYTSTTGTAYCFGADGRKKFSFETAVNPQHAVFIYNYK